MSRKILIYKNSPTKSPVKKIDLTLVKIMSQYSAVKIYKTYKEDAKGNKTPSILPGKPWYVYFYFRNPDNLKMNKFTYQMGINRLKTVKERTNAAKIVKEAFIELLAEGFNPFLKEKETSDILNLNVDDIEFGKAVETSYLKASAKWSEADKDVSKTYYNDFISWIHKSNLQGASVKDVKKRHLNVFLDNLKVKRGPSKGKLVQPTTRNNYRTFIGRIFKQIVLDDYLDQNPVDFIEKLKTNPVKNTPFTPEELQSIRVYLLDNDTYLLQFIQFMLYGLLRESEICRLKIGNIDLSNNKINIQTKTESQAFLRIIKNLEPVVQKMNLDNYNASDFVFTKNETPGEWTTSKHKSKVDWFGRRFKKVKQHLGLGPEYGLYSFRHNAILNLHENLTNTEKNEEEVFNTLMGITRHKSRSGLKNYLREIGAFVPKDYSDLSTLDF